MEYGEWDLVYNVCNMTINICFILYHNRWWLYVFICNIHKVHWASLKPLAINNSNQWVNLIYNLRMVNPGPVEISDRVRGSLLSHI